MAKFNLLIAMVAMIFLGGCWEDVSLDRHTFRSTPLQPTTVILVDTTTDEEFWKMDVPVCMRLRLDFARQPEVEGFLYNPNPADKVTWKLLELDGSKVIDEGTCFLDGCRPFLIKVRYRDAPEQRDEGSSIIRSSRQGLPAEASEISDATETISQSQGQTASVMSNSSSVISNTQGYGQPQPTQFSEVIEQPVGVYGR